MPKLNPYYIKKVETEEVRYLKDEIPTYEEFMKTYQGDKVVENSYEIEYQDNLLHTSQYGPCSYSQYQGNAGHHVDICRSLDCDYYQRMIKAGILGNTAIAGVGSAVTAVSTVGWIGALMATPFTGGGSLLLAAGLSAGASASAVGGTALTALSMKVNLDNTIKNIENELRSKWGENERAKENERVKEREKERIREREREKTRKINSLRGQLEDKKKGVAKNKWNNR